MHNVVALRANVTALLTVTLLLSFLALPASAHEEPTAEAPTRPNARQLPLMPAERLRLEEERKAQREAFQAERATFEANRETRLAETSARRTAVAEATQTRVKEILEKTKERFIAIVGRLTDITGRIETRIAKLDERDVDTSEAKRHLADAKDHLAEVRALLTATDASDVDVVLSSTSPADYLVGLREKIKHIHALIKEAHMSIRNAVEALGAAVTADTRSDVE